MMRTCSAFRNHRIAIRSCVGLLACLLSVVRSDAQESVPSPAVPRSTALSPEESLSQIVIADGYRVRLLAHEPQVIDPVDAMFDELGRLWVVEMRDYPYPTDASPRGTIRVLSDKDEDGHFESAQVFADRLEMPTGLARWKDGVVVTLGGQVVWFRDTDGDLRADQQQVWIEGFAKENEQLRANHPRLGPDGWWYIASGLRGGNVIAGPEFRREGDQPIALGSRDVRFRPSTKQLEAITGPAQFGICFDQIGNRIFCSNRNPAVLVRFEQTDLVGNPLAGLLLSVTDLIPAGENSKVYPLVHAWTTSNLHAGQFTAACGVFWHMFPQDVKDNDSQILVCEPTGSLVHRAGFDGFPLVAQAKPSHSSEWLASRDPWFRPVNVASSPGGGVLIVDMHRAVIEHPQWVPDELKKRVDERWGEDCGRLYLVTRESETSSRSPASIARAAFHDVDDRKLVERLAHEDPWVRETGQRILIEREWVSVELARTIAVDKSRPMPERIAVLQLLAVWLERISSAERADALSFLSQLITSDEPSVAVRIVALRLAQKHAQELAGLRDNVIHCMSKAEDHELIECVRFLASQSVLSGESELALAKQLVRTLSRENHGESQRQDVEVLMTIAGALRTKPAMVQAALFKGLQKLRLDPSDRESIARIELYSTASQRLSLAVAEQQPDATAELINVASEVIQSEVSAATSPALAFLDELLRRKQAPSGISRFLESDANWSAIRNLAGSEMVPDSIRRRAIPLLAKSPHYMDWELASKLVRTGEPSIRAAALRAWATTSDADCDAYLLSELASSSPQQMQLIVELIGQKPQRLEALAELIDQGKLQARQLGAIELKKLTSRAKGDALERLQKALASIENSDRAKVVADYQDCLTMSGDAVRGKAIFAKHCASCHRIADVGVQVGPDISDSRTQLPAQILVNILDPNRAIDNNYFRFVALTDDDRVIEGMISEETSDAIVLKGQNDTRTVLKRTELQELKATGVSLMPEGIETQIDRQSMADLISFVKNWRYMDGSIPK